MSRLPLLIAKERASLGLSSSFHRSAPLRLSTKTGIGLPMSEPVSAILVGVIADAVYDEAKDHVREICKKFFNEMFFRREIADANPKSPYHTSFLSARKRLASAMLTRQREERLPLIRSARDAFIDATEEDIPFNRALAARSRRLLRIAQRNGSRTHVVQHCLLRVHGSA